MEETDMKEYITPEIKYVCADNMDVITTSNIESGVETDPMPALGTWETIA